jgi:hypothetical protein
VGAELRFSEAEANEILRAAIRIAAPGKIARDELAIFASQLGIGEQELAAAEEKYERLKTEEGERQEFQRLQNATFKMMLAFELIFLLGPVTVLSAIHWNDPARWIFPLFGLLCNGPVLVLMAWVYWERTLSSDQYKADFTRWRYYRKLSPSPEWRFEFVDEVISNHIQSEHITTLFGLRLAVKRALGCDWSRAVAAVDEYFDRRPEMRAKVQGAR